MQEDIAFPAMMEIGTGTTPGDTAAFIDIAASNHMVTAESRLSAHHVVTKINCSVRIKGPCGLSSATSKGTLLFRIRNDRHESVPIDLEVLAVANLGASTYNDAVGGVDAAGWGASMAEKHRSLIEHDVFEWVDPPEGIQAIPSRFLYRWKCNQDGAACRQKSRVVVQGFHEADTEADEAAPVASQESVHILTANAAKRWSHPQATRY